MLFYTRALFHISLRTVAALATTVRQADCQQVELLKLIIVVKVSTGLLHHMIATHNFTFSEYFWVVNTTTKYYLQIEGELLIYDYSGY